MPPTTPTDLRTAPVRSRRQRLARLGGTLLTVTMSVALIIFVAMTVLRFSGGELLAIRTGSMRPSMQPGDLLVARDVDPRTIRRGDVITVRVPSADNVLVTHRVTEVDPDGNTFTTKGDANDTVDPFTTKAKDVLGTRWFSIPGIGRVMVFLSSGLGTALLILIPAGIYLGQTLVDRRAARRAAELDAAGTGPDDPPTVGDATPPPDPGPHPTPVPPPFPAAPPPFPAPPPPFPPVATPVPPAPWTAWPAGHPSPWPSSHPAAVHTPAPPQVIVVQVPACAHHAPVPSPAPHVDLHRTAPATVPPVTLSGGTVPPLAVAVSQLPPEVSERLGSQWALVCPIDASVAAHSRLTQEH